MKTVGPQTCPAYASMGTARKLPVNLYLSRLRIYLLAAMGIRDRRATLKKLQLFLDISYYMVAQTCVKEGKWRWNTRAEWLRRYGLLQHNFSSNVSRNETHNTHSLPAPYVCSNGIWTLPSSLYTKLVFCSCQHIVIELVQFLLS
jgi:hypothetical protein